MFSYLIEVTIDHTMISGSHTNFPIPVDITSNDLKTVANGGLVQNTNGYDIVFFSDANLTSKLDYEPLHEYDGAVGRVRTWLKMPTLADTAGQKYYIGVGDASISTFQGNGPGVWSNGYLAVYHLSNNGSTVDVSDALGNYNGTNNGATAETSNPISLGGAAFDGTDDYIQLPNMPNAVNGITVSAWVRRTNTSRRRVVGKYNSDDAGKNYLLDVNESIAGRVTFRVRRASNADSSANGDSSNVPNNTWTYVIGTWSPSIDSGYCRIYINGVESAYGSRSGPWTNPLYDPETAGTYSPAIGYRQDTGSGYWDGQLADIQISTEARSDDWINLEYVRYDGDFQTAGSATPISVTRRIIIIN